MSAEAQRRGEQESAARSLRELGGGYQARLVVVKQVAPRPFLVQVSGHDCLVEVDFPRPHTQPLDVQRSFSEQES